MGNSNSSNNNDDSNTQDINVDLYADNIAQSQLESQIKTAQMAYKEAAQKVKKLQKQLGSNKLLQSLIDAGFASKEQQAQFKKDDSQARAELNTAKKEAQTAHQKY